MFGGGGNLFDDGAGASQTYLAPMFGQRDPQSAYPSTPRTPGTGERALGRIGSASARRSGYATESPSLQRYFRERGAARGGGEDAGWGGAGSSALRPGASGDGSQQALTLGARGDVVGGAGDGDEEDDFLPPSRSMFDDEDAGTGDGGRVSPPHAHGNGDAAGEGGGWAGEPRAAFGVGRADEAAGGAARAGPSPARADGVRHSVVVFGFSRRQVGAVLRRMRELGTVVHNAVPAHGNYMLVQFDTRVAAGNARAMSGRRVTLDGEPVILGVRDFSLEADGEEFLQAAPSGLGAPTPRPVRRGAHRSTLVKEDIFLPRESRGLCDKIMRMLFSW